MKLSVLSYNIHKGFSVGNTRFVLDSIRKAIREVKADLVFLQEVQGEQKKKEDKIENWPKASQFEFLADEIWDHYAYGKNAVYEEGHHGNAILSKYPIKSWENVDLTATPFAKRGLLHAVLEIPETKIPLHAFCLHLDLIMAGRKAQKKKIIERVKEHVLPNEPIIVAGDFNDWSEKATKVLEDSLNVQEVFLKHTGEHAKSFPSKLPALKLDRIYSKGLDIISARTLTGEPWSKLSDHIALYAELWLSESPSSKEQCG